MHECSLHAEIKIYLKSKLKDHVDISLAQSVPWRLLAFNLTAPHHLLGNVLYIRFRVQYVYGESRCLVAFQARSMEWAVCLQLLAAGRSKDALGNSTTHSHNPGKAVSTPPHPTTLRLKMARRLEWKPQHSLLFYCLRLELNWYYKARRKCRTNHRLV